MTFGIVINCADFLPFFTNVACCLTSAGHEVYFLNPNWYMRFILRKERIPYLLYSEQTFLEVTDTIDHFVVWNGSKSFEREVLLNNNKVTTFAELGYFPQTMQINNRGVNAQAEYADLDLEEFFKLSYAESPPVESFTQIKNVRIKYFLAYSVYLLCFYRLRLVNQIVQIFKNNFYKWKFRRLPLENIDFTTFGDYIFFPLQVNCDSQILYNSQYESMYDILERVVPRIKQSGYKLIIKEHPFEREHVDYSHFVDNETIFLLKKCDLESAIENAKFVMTVNSSVGLQAIGKYKRTLLLGECFYKNAPIALQNSELANILDDLETLETMSVDKEIIDQYINHFKADIFASVNFFDFEVDDIQRFCQRVMRCIQ